MEQQPAPKRRGRPPKNLNANTTRLKKPAAKSLGPERRQTRQSKAGGGLLPVPDEGNINLLQEPTDYQITLIDVKSSYHKDTGMFTISGLRRGMIDILPWSSASIAPDSPKSPRVEIDLTLSDSDGAPGGGDTRVPAKRPRLPLSAKRKTTDEDIPEATVSEKRPKIGVEPSTGVAPAEATSAISTEALPPMALLGLRSSTKRRLDEISSMANFSEGNVFGIVGASATGQQAANSLFTPSIPAGFRSLSLQQLFEQRERTGGSSKFGQTSGAERRGSTIIDAGSEPDMPRDSIKTEPGSTLDSPIILDDHNGPPRPLATPTRPAIYEEQIATKHVVNSDDTRANLERQMAYGVRPVQGVQKVIPVKPETLNGQETPEEKTTVLPEHGISVGRGVSGKQAVSEEDVVFIEQRTIEGPTSTRKDVIFEEINMPNREAEAFMEPRTALKPAMAEVHHMASLGPATTKEEPTHTEQNIAPIQEEIFNKSAAAHQPILGEQVVSSVPGAPLEGQRTLGRREIAGDERSIPNRRPAPDSETTVLFSQAVSNERVDKGPTFLGSEPNLGERAALSGGPIVINTQTTPYGRYVPKTEAARPDEQVGQAIREDAAVPDEQAIFNAAARAFDGRTTRREEATVLGEQAISCEKATASSDQIIQDEEVVIIDERTAPDRGQSPDDHVGSDAPALPVKQLTSSEPPSISEQTPRMVPGHRGIGIPATDLMVGSVDDGSVFGRTPWRSGFSGDSAASQREKLEPPNVSKECPVCGEKFRDMSIPDLRQHILSCLEEERPQPPEYADEEYLGLVRRTTVFLEDLGSDNGAGEDPDNDDLHIGSSQIVNGPLGAITRFRDRSMSDSEGTLSEAISDEEQLPGPYEEKEISSDDNESPIVDIIDTIASKFRAITDPEKFLPSLQDPEEKTTASLYRSIDNAAGVLKAWQDEWMVIEARVARLQQRKAHNPRAVLDPVVFEDQKEADLYGYRWDPNPKKRGQQDPVAQRIGRLVGGRELRRRAPALKGLAVDSDAGTQEGRRTRSRRGDGTSDLNGSGVEGPRPAVIQNGLEISSVRRSMKRSADLIDADTPEQSDTPKRRGRPRLNPLPARIQDIRNGNTFSATSTESEGTPAPVVKRRGRPPKHLRANQAVGTKAENMDAGKGKRGADKAVGGNTPGTPNRVGSSEVTKKPKSAKRSAAMQAWWDQRKAEKRARMEAAAAASAAPDADTSVAEPSAEKPDTGKPTREAGSAAKAPKGAVADKDDTPVPVPQKRRGRPPKQPAILAVESPGPDGKVFQPKRRGRPPKSGLKVPFANSQPNAGGTVGRSNLDSTPNPLLGKPTGFEQYQQLAGGSIPGIINKKRRNLSDRDGASISGERANTSPSSFDGDSDATQTTETSSNDTDDDDGDDSYYG